MSKCHKCQNKLPITGYYYKKLGWNDESGGWEYKNLCEPCMEKAIEQKEVWDVLTISLAVDDWHKEIGPIGRIDFAPCNYCQVSMPEIRRHEKKDGKVIKLKHNCKTDDEEIKRLQGKGNDNPQEREREKEREQNQAFKEENC